eukprot:scaffold26426_cov44-Cyclotella_meneghiniana.AAC.1
MSSAKTIDKSIAGECLSPTFLSFNRAISITMVATCRICYSRDDTTLPPTDNGRLTHAVMVRFIIIGSPAAARNSTAGRSSGRKNLEARMIKLLPENPGKAKKLLQ